MYCVKSLTKLTRLHAGKVVIAFFCTTVLEVQRTNVCKNTQPITAHLHYIYKYFFTFLYVFFVNNNLTVLYITKSPRNVQNYLAAIQ